MGSPTEVTDTSEQTIPVGEAFIFHAASFAIDLVAKNVCIPELEEKTTEFNKQLHTLFPEAKNDTEIAQALAANLSAAALSITPPLKLS